VFELTVLVQGKSAAVARGGLQAVVLL
jgi:hypothetical protein